MKFINEQSLRELIRKRKLDSFAEELIKELDTVIEGVVNEKLKKYLGKQRLVKIDDSKQHLSPRVVLSKEQIDKLPSWVMEDIDNSFIVGESRCVIQTSDGKKYHIKNPLNDLSGGEWTFF